MNTIKKFLRIRAVVEATGKSRSTILRAVKANSFPSPIHIGPRAIAWDLEEVLNWQQERIIESRTTPELSHRVGECMELNFAPGLQTARKPA